MYNLEYTLLISSWIATIVSTFFIPKKKACEASFIFILSQVFSWLLGLVVVEYGMIEYPVHILSKANSTDFMFEFLIFPVLAIHFILRYPSAKILWLRLTYFIGTISMFTLAEVIIEKYTMIIKYYSWTWYDTWISMALSFYFIMVIYKWFFKKPPIFSL